MLTSGGIDMPVLLDCWFSCKTLPCSNTSVPRSVAINAVWDATTETGFTLWGVRLVAERVRPKTMIMENVTGLMANGQLDAVSDMFRGAGYYAITTWLDPLRLGHPQQRDRLYLLAWRLATLSRAGLTEATVLALVQEAMEATARDHKLADSNVFLFSEDRELFSHKASSP